MSVRLAALALAAGLGGIVAPALSAEPAPPGARLYIIWPKNGQVIQGGKFWLRMGLKNAGVAPAGIRKEGTGHHHVLIDADLPPPGEPIPNNRNHLHFGAGQTEARVALNPGAHTLQLLFADENHVPHDPPVMSKPIKVTVAVPSTKKKKKKRRSQRYRYY
jgi:hypothetical protein